MTTVHEIAVLSDVGLQTPALIVGTKPPLAHDFNILIGHGLGSGNPKEKTHLKDRWVDLVGRGSKLTERNSTIISYTARGHGESRGWEDTADTNPRQFTWQKLSLDMIAIADYYELPTFVASGSSMGSATSLFAAIEAPLRARGVIMVRPPTAWAERRARKKYLLGSAAKCAERELHGEKYHYVLQGAALADLPDPQLEADLYSSIRCPVLILTVEGDATHPVSTARALDEVLPNSELHIALDAAAALRDWPDVIAKFLVSLPEIHRPIDN